MKIFLTLCVLFVASSAFAYIPYPPEGVPSDWVDIVNIAFDPGHSDMANAPNNLYTLPVKTDRFAMLISNDCRYTSYEEMYVRSNGQWWVEFQDYQEVKRQQTQDGQWVFFSVTSPLPPTFVGYRVTNTGNWPCHTAVWQHAMVTPPPPPPPGKPVMQQCAKVASNLKTVEYPEQIEQAVALAETPTAPCQVYIRFLHLAGYRYFLEHRQAQGKSPDFEILQPDNVRVDLTHAVLN